MSPYRSLARFLSKRIRNRISRKATGKELFDFIQGLGLTDPEGDFCKCAGVNNIGRIKCEECPLSNRLNAGCMRFIQPAIDHALSSRVRQSKLKLELLAQELDRISNEGDGSEIQG